MTATRSPASAVQQPTFGRLLGHLLVAGLAAGALSGAFSLLVTQRAMAPALAIEQARTGTHAQAEELVGRAGQVWGGVLGAVLAAVVFAVLLAVAYALLRHRLPVRTDFARVVLLAAIGFGVFALLPALKIPANPPAVGDPATVTTRTGIYTAVLLSGLAIAILVSVLVSLLRSRGVSIAATASVTSAAAAALVALLLVLVPGSPDAVPADVPAGVVWDFRLASLGQLAVLWAGLGLAGGWLVERSSPAPAGRAWRRQRGAGSPPTEQA